MIRLFAAIAVPAPVGRALAQAQQGLKGARWRPAESLHVTLRFFGAVAEPVAADLDEALAAFEAPAFDLSLRGVGCFDEGGRINAVWAGVAEQPRLARLARACESAARRCGLKPETRNFHPHVTLAYLNRPAPEAVAAWIQDHNLLRTDVFRADAFGLYSSWPGEQRSSYRRERIYRLSGETGAAPA